MAIVQQGSGADPSNNQNLTPEQRAAKQAADAAGGTQQAQTTTAAGAPPAEAKPAGMSDQDWTNFQARYRPATPPPAAGAAAGGGGTAAAGGGTTATTQPNTVAGAAAGAQTYATNPGGAIAENTTNAGTQDTVRNSYLQQATQPTTVNTNDPAFRQQADTFAASEERARREQSADLAEATAGTGQTGFQTGEQRLINERSAQKRGAFEADLVKQELTVKRGEIQNALQMLSGQISEDQKNNLTKKLAEIDAQLKTAALNSSNALGGAELALKDKLGTMGGNIDLLGLLMNNQQFGQNLGFQIGDREEYWNQQALNNILG